MVNSVVSYNNISPSIYNTYNQYIASVTRSVQIIIVKSFKNFRPWYLFYCFKIFFCLNLINWKSKKALNFKGIKYYKGNIKYIKQSLFLFSFLTQSPGSVQPSYEMTIFVHEFTEIILRVSQSLE